ncbi:YtfJ family protein [Sorangium sp. So ce429]
MNMQNRPTAPRRPWPTRLLSAASAAALSLALISGAALALPSEGDRAPNARLEDADGRELQMKALRGKPILIVYEDKDSATQNQAFKDALAKLAKGDRYRRAIALAAIADVSSYDYWPVKGFVKDAIREESRKVGATIYCDWDGTFREAYRLRRGISNVILVGKNGQVLFAAEGKLKPEAQGRVLDLLRKEVEG